MTIGVSRDKETGSEAAPSSGSEANKASGKQSCQELSHERSAATIRIGLTTTFSARFIPFLSVLFASLQPSVMSLPFQAKSIRMSLPRALYVLSCHGGDVPPCRPGRTLAPLGLGIPRVPAAIRT